MSDTRNRSRHPAGTPSGGRFASTAHTESEVELGTNTAVHAGAGDTAPDDAAPGAGRDIAGPGMSGASIRRKLGGLREGQRVTVHDGGKAQDVTVQRRLHRQDGGFGHPEHAKVTVGYGPGRWNREVSPAQIADGFVTLTVHDEEAAR